MGSGEDYAAALAGRSVFSSLSSYPAEWVEALTPTALRHFIEREKLQLGSAFVIAIDCAGDDGQLPHAVREATGDCHEWPFSHVHQTFFLLP